MWVTCCSSTDETYPEILRSVDGRAHVHLVVDRRDVPSSVRLNGSVAVFADAVDLCGASLVIALRGQWTGMLGVPVIAAVRPIRGEIACMAALVRAGAADLLLLGHDDAWQVLARVLDERHQSGSSWRNWFGTPRTHAAAFVGDCMLEVRRGANAEELARSLGLSVSSLHRRCRDLELPPPGKLLRWLRLLATLEEVGGSNASLSEVARRCGYSSVATMRAAFGEMLGLRPSEVRSSEILTRAIDHCRRALFHTPNADSPGSLPSRATPVDTESLQTDCANRAPIAG